MSDAGVGRGPLDAVLLLVGCLLLALLAIVALMRRYGTLTLVLLGLVVVLAVLAVVP